MTSSTVTDPAAAPWERAVAELVAEATFLSRHLGQPLARTAGVAGILSRLTPSTLWVHDEIDVDELLGEVDGWQPAPEVMVPAHLVGPIVAMQDRGWVVTARVQRLRHDIRTGDQAPPPSAFLIRAAGPDDLPALRLLHASAFRSDDPAAYLPDEMLSVPGLRMFVAALPQRPDRVVGVAGIRRRHEGALVFALATAPQLQRQGIGTALVRTCLAWGADQGAPFAIADVNVPVPALWSRLGFAPTGEWCRFAPA
jgi:GNAT superfamily N-acetyltransferase